MVESLELFTKFWPLILLSVKSIARHKLRSSLSILGIICGVMAVLTMISISEGAKHELLAQINRLGTQNIYVKTCRLTESQRKQALDNLSLGLIREDEARIRNGCVLVDSIAVVRDIKVAVLGGIMGKNPQVAACSANYADILGLGMHRGRFFNAMDEYQKNMVCVIGCSLAKALGAGGQIGAFLRIEKQLFRIIGHLKGVGNKSKKIKKSVFTIRDYNHMVMIPMGTESVFISRFERDGERRETGKLTEMIIRIKGADTVINAGKIITRILNISHGGITDYQVIIPKALLFQAQETQRIFNLVLGAIAGISLIVGGIGIMNIMLATVYERTREIGIRRSVGATRGDIVRQFLSESVILTLTGGMVGVVLGVIASFIVAEMGKWHTQITLWAVCISVIMAVAVGVFFGLYPAIKASRMDPIKALRFD